MQYAITGLNSNQPALTPVNQVLVELCCKVHSVSNINTFRIYSEELNRVYKCVCDFPCLVQEGDSILGQALLEAHTSSHLLSKDNKLEDRQSQLKLLRPPLVQMARDAASITKAFIRALRGRKFGPSLANSFLQFLKLKNGSLDNALVILDRMACHWIKHRNPDVFIAYLAILREDQMQKLLSWWYRNRCLRCLYLLNINNWEIRSINLPLDEIHAQVLKNPYVYPALAMDKCEQLIKLVGLELTTPQKFCGEVIRKIYQYMSKKGWSGVPTGIFLSLFPQIETESNYLKQLQEEFNLVLDAQFNCVYLTHAYQVETTLATFINRLLKATNLKYELSNEAVTYTQRSLTQDQREAIVGAISSNISIISGGAGTGKTTVIRQIVHNLEAANLTYRVVSPTGKSVARLKEVLPQSKRFISTIHRLLVNKRNDNNSSTEQFDHLIIDEVSMVTSPLLYEFITKYNFDYRITLVGDINQLPPIGWGYLLDQLLKSRLIPVFLLTQMHRTQASQDNGILINATNLVKCCQDNYTGPPFEYTITPNFRLLKGDLDSVNVLVRGLADSGIEPDKICVICPYNKYLPVLNKLCQNIFNLDRRGVQDYQGRTWKLKDRVMMTYNDDQINVMNREEGLITDLTDKEIKVTFRDSASHIFTLGPATKLTKKQKEQAEFSDFTEKDKDKKKDKLSVDVLMPAFAITIDCSQGSEWPYIILYLPVPDTSDKDNPFANLNKKGGAFLNRNRLYTAITRAKTAIWCVGDLLTFNQAATANPSYRCDNLALRLIDAQTLK